MKFGVLGPIRVLDGDRVVAVPSGRVRTLLAVLLLRAGHVVPVDELVDRLWDETPPVNPRGAVQTYVQRLRRALGPGAALVRTQRHGYVIDVEPPRVDLGAFRLLVRRAADTAEPAGRAALLEEALGLWRGGPLADVPADTLLRDEVPRLVEERLHAMESLMAARLELGRHAEVVAELTALTGEHPLREPFWGQLMVALHRCGRQAEALDAYRTVAATLADQLGIDPGEELRRLHQAIVTGEVGEVGVTGTAGTAGTVAAGEPAGHGWRAVCQLPLEPGGLVGRRAAADRVRELLTRPGPVPVVTVSGPPGVGKTALALHVAHRVRPEFPDGQWFVRLAGAAAPRDPADVLAELLRASGEDGAAVPDGPEERAAALRARLADRRVLLVLDDAAGVAQVAPLLPGTTGNAVLVTSRDDLAGLAVFHGGHGVRLSALDGADAGVLLERALGSARARAEGDAVAELVELCGRLPLALRIAAADLTARPERPVADYVAELRTGDRPIAPAVDGDPHADVRDPSEVRDASGVRDASDVRDAAGGTPGEPRRRLLRLLGAVPGLDLPAGEAAALLDEAAALLGEPGAAKLLDGLAAATTFD
ncbi:MAG TPA: BTAD domain-containing putative transcriptional regulator, partial [Pseudonocardiaceae bacterium]